MANNKFCIECRFELPITAKFCERCGFTFVLNQSTSESKPITQTPIKATPETSESKDFLLEDVVSTTKILTWLYYINLFSYLLGWIINGSLVIFIITSIFALSLGYFVLLWIYQTTKLSYTYNLKRLRISPVWSVVWFFIPIANFYKPYQILSQIYKSSLSVDDRKEWAEIKIPLLMKLFIPLWWIQIINNLVMAIYIGRGGDNFGWLFINIIIQTILYLICIQFIRRVLSRFKQDNGSEDWKWTKPEVEVKAEADADAKARKSKADEKVKAKSKADAEAKARKPSPEHIQKLDDAIQELKKYSKD